jgi:hypothetical protein
MVPSQVGWSSRAVQRRPTEAKRSGGICSSPVDVTNPQVRNQSTICHLDRSVAEWRDLQFLDSK